MPTPDPVLSDCVAQACERIRLLAGHRDAMGASAAPFGVDGGTAAEWAVVIGLGNAEQAHRALAESPTTPIKPIPIGQHHPTNVALLALRKLCVASVVDARAGTSIRRYASRVALSETQWSHAITAKASR